MIAGTGTETYTVTASNTIFTSGAASDTFAVTGNGNTFQAKEGPDNFYDTVLGSAQPSNVVDFSDVGTSSGAPLSVNASGGPQPITVNGSACPSPLANGAAAVGCTAANWTFLNSVGANSASAFPTIEGATTGSTAFLAGGTGGLALNGQGSGNSATFLGNTGVVANLSGGPEITSAQIGTSTTLSNFNLGLGQVLVSAPPQGSGNTCITTPGGDCDTLGGAVGSIATVTGPTSGFSTFYAGAGPGTSTIRGNDGNNNTFIGGSGPDVFTSVGNNNTFVAGSGSATFSELTSVQGANNTINFGSGAGRIRIGLQRPTVLARGQRLRVADGRFGLLGRRHRRQWRHRRHLRLRHGWQRLHDPHRRHRRQHHLRRRTGQLHLHREGRRQHSQLRRCVLGDHSAHLRRDPRSAPAGHP